MGAAVMLAAACEGSPMTGADAGGGDAGSSDGGAQDCSGRPAEAPSTRGEVNGGFDEAGQRIVVFGGNTAAPVGCMPAYEHTDEVRAFHLDCASWERLSVSGGPGARARHATTVDTQRGRMIVFGGRTRAGGTGPYTNFADVWAFDFATDTWSEITTSGTGPSPRNTAVALYDAARDRLIVHGGNTSTDGATYTPAGDTFALDLATGTWSEITSAPAPDARLLHSGVIAGDELVIYGGTSSFFGPFFADAWALDLATDTWRVVHDGSGAAPSARFGGELFADEERGRAILTMGHDFGPPTGPGNMNDVWALDLAGGAWTMLQPGDELTNPDAGFCDFPPDFTTPQEGAPERRYAFVHVQSGGEAFVFGGKTDCGNINDVWSLALSDGAWTQLRPATGGEACNRSGRTGCTSLCF